MVGRVVAEERICGFGFYLFPHPPFFTHPLWLPIKSQRSVCAETRGHLSLLTQTMLQKASWRASRAFNIIMAFSLLVAF